MKLKIFLYPEADFKIILINLFQKKNYTVKNLSREVKSLKNRLNTNTEIKYIIPFKITQRLKILYKMCTALVC